MYYISLCIPTNGILEWVIPSLESIYSQGVEESEFEVVVSDNGDNEEFCKKMHEYKTLHKNFVYCKSREKLFVNQITVLQEASGEYLKFVNHRDIFAPGSLQYMIEFVKKRREDKPVIYWSNGALKNNSILEYTLFENFLCGLGRYITWTTGVGVWKSDFENIPKDHKYNFIDPHSDVLLWERKKQQYIINDKKWSEEIEVSHEKKGKYDLYKCFAVEEPSIILQLLLDGDISPKAFKTIIGDYEKCVADFYYIFNIKKTPCAYDLKGFSASMNIFMSRRRVLFDAWMYLPRKALKKIKRDSRYTVQGAVALR